MNPQELHVIQALEKANSTEHLTAREKHLIGLAVTITRGCTHCTGGRIEKALQSDITQDTLTATADLVAAVNAGVAVRTVLQGCLLYTSPSPRDATLSRMPSSA